MQTLNGLPASPGVYTGRVLIGETADMMIGPVEVLVLRTAGVEWLEAISTAGAVATEVGGKTSHAATICRELGKPCVTAVSGITTALTNGNLVIVDGTAGTVTVV